jgi:hypothetical protein
MHTLTLMGLLLFTRTEDGSPQTHDVMKPRRDLLLT